MRCGCPTPPVFCNSNGARFRYRTAFRFRGIPWWSCRTSAPRGRRTSHASFSSLRRCDAGTPVRTAPRWGSVLASGSRGGRTCAHFSPTIACWSPVTPPRAVFRNQWCGIRWTKRCGRTTGAARPLLLGNPTKWAALLRRSGRTASIRRYFEGEQSWRVHHGPQ